jgi:D-glycero-alpha-D-manno-heptose-7-phosphate kinase
MIISRTPYRISLFGGGTDYPNWYLRHGGAVLATTVDKYCYITCRRLPPFFEHKHRIVWSKVESVNTTDEITHPAVRAVFNHLNVGGGMEIHCVGDLPARSGMGSSSTFTVGLLHGLHALRGRMVSKHELAMEAIYLEQELLKENVGSQDQVSAAYGGFNHIQFMPNGKIQVTPMTIPQSRIDELNSHLMLFYTGIKRTSSGVAESFINKLDEKRRQLRIMKDLVDEGIAILNSNQDIRNFGELFVEAWDAKRSLSKVVSNSEVDDLHAHALDAGAIGGKLLGAGGGGFLLLFVEPGLQRKVKEKLNKFLHVPFKFEFGGSQIVYAAKESDYTLVEAERATKDVAAFRELSELSQGAGAIPDGGA